MPGPTARLESRAEAVAAVGSGFIDTGSLAVRRSSPGAIGVIGLSGLVCLAAFGDDWPTYQHDPARSGAADESLAPPLTPAWVFQTPNPPAEGWAEPEPGEVWGYGVGRRNKVAYDDAYRPIAVGQTVYFAASGENRLCAVDAATGRLRWSFHTAGAPRLAPRVTDGRVYLGDDAGRVYCLDANDGRVVWTFKAAPSDARAIGHGRVMSLWPVRTGVLVADGVAYFGAGVYPAEGLLLYAVRADTGRQLWVNDSFADGGRANLTPQGYLLASPDKLIMPSGRVTPVVFDRSDGRQLYELRGGRGLTGGTWATLAGDLLFNGARVLTAYDLSKVAKDKYGHDVHGPAAFAWFRAERAVIAGPTAYVATDQEVLAIPVDRMADAAKAADALRAVRWEHRNAVAAYERAQATLAELDHNSPRYATMQKEAARHKPQWDAVAAEAEKTDAALDKLCRWRTPCEAYDALILAGDTLFAGGEGQVLAFNAVDGKRLWQGRVRGTARGLAVANGRLLVSTTTGGVYGFVRAAPGVESDAAPKNVAPPVRDEPYPRDGRLKASIELADRIVSETGVRRGFGLILDDDEGRLAWALAQRTELQLYVVEPDAAEVARAREALTAAGLYGARVSVEGDDGASRSFPPYLANLIVCRPSPTGEAPATPANELLRVLRPLGGVAIVGGPAGALDAWGKDLPADQVTIRRDGAWTTLTRGALPGAGRWTHLYADAANTGCSGDTRVHGRLGVLWFGDPGPADMTDRHARGAAPVSIGGRMFVEGPDVVMAYDAYNGLELWRRELPGVGREHVSVDCGNLAASSAGLFVATDQRCLRLDLDTGRTQKPYALPPRPDGKRRRWGWMAVADGVLFGSRTDTDARFRSWPKVSGNTSEAVFAIDIDSGDVRWVSDGKEILHPAIAVGDGAVVFVDRDVTDAQRAKALAEFADKESSAPPKTDRRGEPIPRDVRRVFAVDVATGQPRWSRPLDVTDCVVGPAQRAGAGGEISVMIHDGVVVLCSAPWNGHFIREWQKGQFSRRSLIALDAADGTLLWSGFKGYRSRPIIMGDQIFAEPWAHDLKTGRRKTWPHPLTGRPEPWMVWRGYGGCGTVAAAADTIFFRASSIGWYDDAANEGIVNFGGQRPNCWINFIPAGGVVMVPEGSAYCDCPLAIQGSVVLAPRGRSAAWATQHLAKPLTPVRQIAVNLGAPGDRRDAHGRLWVHCPNRVHKYHWLGAAVAKAPGVGWYFDRLDTRTVDGTDTPWVFTSGCRGLTRFRVPLLGKDDPPATYTVRLSFAEPDGLAAGHRVFSVGLQGSEVLTDFDVAREAGGADRAVVREFRGVEVTDSLAITLTPAASARVPLPILCGVEAVGEDAPND